MDKHNELNRNYEDALFALLMDSVAESQGTQLVYRELTPCCLSTRVYRNCVLKDGESVWNNGKSNVKDGR